MQTVEVSSPKSDTMWFRDFRMSFARSSMRREVAKSIELARAWKDTGLAPGSKQYKDLFQNSLASVHQFSTKFKVNPETVMTEMPSLMTLSKMSEKPLITQKASVFAQIAAVIFVILSAAAILGTASGIFHRVSHLIGGN